MHNPTDLKSQERNVLVVIGTRPEAIKLAPVIVALRDRTTDCRVRVVLTGQHRELVAPILDFFGILPDFDLQIMQENQSPTQVVERTLARIDPLLEKERVDRVVVQGDTSSAMAAALAGFYRKIPVAHVEAGLRTGRLDDPFPEEMNRRLIAQLASIHFAPTERNRLSLLREGVSDDSIHITGNTVIDALHAILERANESELPEEIRAFEGKKLIVLTTHRRENLGEPQRRIFEAINTLLDRHDDIAVIFPVHPNPNVRAAVEAHLRPHARLHLPDPLDYIRFVQLMKSAWLIMTDSGGIQEEAPALGVPAFVLRETTEREEGIESENARLVGTATEAIVQEVEALLSGSDRYRRMARQAFPFGEGSASAMIAERLCT